MQHFSEFDSRFLSRTGSVSEILTNNLVNQTHWHWTEYARVEELTLEFDFDVEKFLEARLPCPDS